MSALSKPRDKCTLSNYNVWRCQHINAELAIDFEQQRMHGTVELQMKQLRSSNKIVLDTSYLDISEVKVNGTKAAFEVASTRIEPFGSPLTITVPEGVSGDVTVKIATSTTDKCTALQWMNAEQTSNRKYPYMFSQCQAIHARSVFPCQDTPDVKATVDFAITSPLTVLASGVVDGSIESSVAGNKVYKFVQRVPIPSYLFAVASGDIVGAQVGPRSTVYSGPNELADCKWELDGDVDKFIQVADKLIYPYQWGPYNVLVLPPSFPYGGMENPIVTFATPTIISKDKQNIDVIAHELAHSWSGNLVSAGSWEHFWLNEGWTTYIERRIAAALHGEAHRDFSAIIGWKALEESVEQFGADHEFTKLIPDLEGKDPDDAFSTVPYDKGHTFLYYLEKLVGQSKWDKFIPHYFTTWNRKSLDSFEFKATLLDFFASDAEATAALAAVDWNTWFYGAGLPPKPDFATSMVDVCYDLANKWLGLNAGATSFSPAASDISSWQANQTVVFLEKLQSSPPLSPATIDKLGEVYSLASSSNVELVSRYYTLGLAAQAPSVLSPTADLLGQVGRMKFVRPLYKGLLACDPALAHATFSRHRAFYHPICRGMVEKMLSGARRGGGN